MAIEVERMVAMLEANFSKYDRALNKALGNTNRQFTAIERRGKQMESRLANIGNGLGRSILGGLAAGVSMQAARSLVDSATQIQNSLKVAGLAGEDLQQVYEKLFVSAQKNAAPLEALVTLYGRMATAQKELNATQAEMLQFTDVVGMSLRVSGQSAQESAGALLQLSQAMGGGKVQAEEYNSLLDGARPLLQAVAAGMQEAGGSVAALTRLVKDGKVSSEAFFRAGIAGAGLLEGQVKTSESTISSRFTRLQNVLTDAAGKFDRAAGASKSLGTSIDGLSNIIAKIDWSNLVKQAEGVGDAIQGALDVAKGVSAELGRESGLDQFGVWLSDLTEFDLATPSARGSKTYWDKLAEAEIEERNRAFQRVADDPMQYGPQRPRPQQGPMPRRSAQGPERPGPRAKPITLEDYKVTDSKSGSKSGRGGRDELAGEIAQIQERTAALQAMTAAQAALNPAIDDFGFAVEKAAAKQDLINAAQKAGKTITPLLSAQIDQLATAYANAVLEGGKLAETQDEIRQRMEDAREFNKDLTRGIVDGFIEGRDAGELFADTLKKIGSRFLDLALNAASDPKSGFLGSIGAALFSSLPGRASGGPVRKGQPYIVGERRAEVFVPETNGKVLSSVPKAPKASSSNGGGGSFSFAPSYTIDARGADQAAVDRLERGLARSSAELEARVMKIVRDRPKKGW